MANDIQKNLIKNRKTILFGFGIGALSAFILLIVFFAGIAIGSRRFGIPFPERRYGFPGGFIPSRFGHGAVGSVDSIGSNTFIVKERSGELETILVDDATVLRQDNSSIKFSDLKKGEEVIVIGDPEQQEQAIKARFIRVITAQ